MKSGFSLIEFMVYLAMFALMMGLAFHFLSSMHIGFSTRSKHAHWLMKLYSAQQAMIRELEKAPPELQHWKKNSKNEVIFSGDEYEVGFAVVDGSLVRIKGRYEVGSGWAKKHKTLLATHVASIYFNYDTTSDQIQGIGWNVVGELEQNSYTVNEYVAIRNHKKMLNKNENYQFSDKSRS